MHAPTSIYVINLANRSDRLAQFTASFRARCKNFVVRRIDAVAGRTLDFDGPLMERVDPGHREIGARLPAVIGCSLSHLSAYEAILSSGAPWGFVFEDDAVPLALLSRIDLADVARRLPEEFNVAYLCDSLRSRRRRLLHALHYVDRRAGVSLLRPAMGDVARAGGWRWRQPDDDMYTAEAYVISRAFAEHMIVTSREALGSADGTLMKHRGWRDGAVFAAWPPLFAQRDKSDTDIQVGSKPVVLTASRKIPL